MCSAVIFKEDRVFWLKGDRTNFLYLQNSKIIKKNVKGTKLLAQSFTQFIGGLLKIIIIMMIYHKSELYRTNVIFSNIYNILFKSIKYLCY